MPNHCSTGFIQEQWTGVKWATKRGWAASHCSDELAMMDRDVVGEQVDRGDRGGDGPVEVLQEGEVLDLALATGGHAVDLPGAGVEGGEQVGGAGPPVLVLDLDRATGLGRAGGDAARSRLERGHLVEAEHDLVRGQGAGQQIGDRPDVRGERRVARACADGARRAERQGFRRSAASIRWTVWGEIAATTSSGSRAAAPVPHSPTG